MSSLLSDPRVTVFVGDGFKFLAENTATYDAIITDSSDPVGPAASLFQKPYFELLRDALAPGGHISTQAECLWLHLPLIHELRETTRSLFPVAEYAFTTIPTYPSGQIGFVVCSKEPGRNLKFPVRKVPDTRYYNQEVHKAAFVLPEFARSITEDGQNILPKVGRQFDPAKPVKKVLLLGSGFVARPAAEYVVRNPNNQLTIGKSEDLSWKYQTDGTAIACRTLSTAESLAADLPNATGVSLDVTDSTALEKAVAEHDLVISLVPYIYHPAVIKAAIKGNTNVVTTSYVSPAIRELEEEIKKAGIVVMNEIGLDPGIDHLYAVKLIDEVHAKGGKVYCTVSIGRLRLKVVQGQRVPFVLWWAPCA